MHNGRTGSFDWQKRKQHAHRPILSMSVKGTSTISGLVSTVIHEWLGYCYAWQTYWPLWLATEIATWSPPHFQHECQQSVNDLWSCKYGDSQVTWSLLCITDVLAACIGKRDSNTVTAPFLAWASMERQRFVVLWVRYFTSDLVVVMHNGRIGCFYWQKR